MSKRKSKSKATTSSKHPTCEYYCSGNQWWFVGGHPGTGYTCPSTLGYRVASSNWACAEGTTTTILANPTSQTTTSKEASCNYAEYLFLTKTKTFRFVGGKCDPGFYLPPDIAAYSAWHKEYAKLIEALVDFANRYPEIHEVKIVLPPELISDCRDRGHNPGHNPPPADANRNDSKSNGKRAGARKTPAKTRAPKKTAKKSPKKTSKKRAKKTR